MCLLSGTYDVGTTSEVFVLANNHVYMTIWPGVSYIEMILDPCDSASVMVAISDSVLVHAVQH